MRTGKNSIQLVYKALILLLTQFLMYVIEYNAPLLPNIERYKFAHSELLVDVDFL